MEVTLIALSTVGARSCLVRPLGDDHCLPKWATSLMLVESTGELMQALVHHLMRAPESHQATLVLGWTPLPLGNQPTHIGAKSVCSHHDVVWSVLTRMHAFGCVGQLRSQLEHRIARTSKLEKFLKVVLFAAHPIPQLLSCMRHRFDAPSGLGDPLSDAWTFLWCLSLCLGLRLEVWRDIHWADVASSFNLANLALVRSTSPCTSSNFFSDRSKHSSHDFNRSSTDRTWA